MRNSAIKEFNFIEVNHFLGNSLRINQRVFFQLSDFFQDLTQVEWLNLNLGVKTLFALLRPRIQDHRPVETMVVQ